MKVQYYPKSDMLTVDLAQGPATGGGEEVKEGIVLFYDEQDRLVSIEIEGASQRVDLTDIQADPSHIVDESEGVQELLTISQLAQRWNIDPRTLRKTLQSMAQAGLEVGQSLGATNPIILTEDDVKRIQTWREDHKPGRPRAKKTELQER